MDIRSPTEGRKSPIKAYTARYCSTCEDKEGCGYIKTDLITLCAALRLLELKEKQMYKK